MGTIAKLKKHKKELEALIVTDTPKRYNRMTLWQIERLESIIKEMEK